jgi:capsular polysaccharide biosynthesis protein
MELRQYWNVIWKRRWLVLAIVLVATAASAFMALTSKRSFETQIRLITRQEPTSDTFQQNYFIFDRYYNWFGSEFLVDDYTQITTSDAFANSVLATMKESFFPEQTIEDWNNQLRAAAEPGQTPSLLGQETADELETNIGKLSPQEVKEAISSDRRHRELRLTITADDSYVAKAIADAAGVVLADAKMQPIRGDMVDDKGVFAQIDQAGVFNIQSSRSREIINAIVRVIIAVAAAIALAFLLEYLDNSVRDERDATRIMELPVLGAIPRT